jgi:hypothetical protein
MLAEPDERAGVRTAAKPDDPVAKGARRARRRRRARIDDWDSLAESLQLTLAAAALQRASATLALQAKTLAREMEAGGLEDRGGPEALRLLAAIVEVTGEPGLGGALAP